MRNEIEDMVMVKSVKSKKNAQSLPNQLLSYNNYDWTIFLNQFSTFKEITHHDSLINETRITQLKNEIASGRYEINSEQIAIKLVADL